MSARFQTRTGVEIIAVQFDGARESVLAIRLEIFAGKDGHLGWTGGPYLILPKGSFVNSVDIGPGDWVVRWERVVLTMPNDLFQALFMVRE